MCSETADHLKPSHRAVSELLTALPKVLGERWLKHLIHIFPTLTPYLASGHPASDRSLAIGIIAESWATPTNMTAT